MFVEENSTSIYLQGMRDRSMRSGTKFAREIQLTDWSTAGNLSNRSSGVQMVGKVCIRANVAHQAGAYPGFRSMKRLGVLLLPPGWDASPSQGYPPALLAGTHLYTWVERGTVKVKCLAQEHNTMSPARARTRTARSEVERTNHEATAPPTGVQIPRDICTRFRRYLYSRRCSWIINIYIYQKN